MVVDIGQFKICGEVAKMVHNESIQPVIFLPSTESIILQFPYDPRAHACNMFILQLRQETDLCLVFPGSIKSSNAPMMVFDKGINDRIDVVITMIGLKRAMEVRCQVRIIPSQVPFVGRNKKSRKRSPNVREQSPMRPEEV